MLESPGLKQSVFLSEKLFRHQVIILKSQYEDLKRKDFLVNLNMPLGSHYTNMALTFQIWNSANMNNCQPL